MVLSQRKLLPRPNQYTTQLCLSVMGGASFLILLPLLLLVSSIQPHRSSLMSPGKKKFSLSPPFFFLSLPFFFSLSPLFFSLCNKQFLKQFYFFIFFFLSPFFPDVFFSFFRFSTCRPFHDILYHVFPPILVFFFSFLFLPLASFFSQHHKNKNNLKKNKISQSQNPTTSNFGSNNKTIPILFLKKKKFY